LNHQASATSSIGSWDEAFFSAESRKEGQWKPLKTALKTLGCDGIPRNIG